MAKLAVKALFALLWMHDSKVTGKLNHIKVPEAGGERNVSLALEGKVHAMSGASYSALAAPRAILAEAGATHVMHQVFSRNFQCQL